MTISDALGADEISNDLPAFVRKSHKLSEVGGAFFNLPQIVVVLEAGDTANPSGLMSGPKSRALRPSLSCLIYLPSAAIK